MDIKASVLSGGSKLIPIPSEDRSPEWLKDETPRWIDIEAPEADKLSEYLAPLGIPQDVIESCLKPSVEPGLGHYEDLIYIEYPILVKDRDFQRAYVSIIYLPTMLITIHMERFANISLLEAGLSMESRYQSSNIPGLLHEIIVNLSMQMYRYFQDVRNRINYLSDAINEDPDSVELVEILSTVRIVDIFITLIEDQHYCVESLLASRSKAVGLGDRRQYYHDLSRRIQNGLRMLNRYDARVNDLHQHYMLTLQDRTNSRLKVLTIISAIFLPLTLLAGIYGMNFQHMPELQNQYAYFIVLGLMFVVALTMLIFFYVRGWFK